MIDSAKVPGAARAYFDGGDVRGGHGVDCLQRVTERRPRAAEQQLPLEAECSAIVARGWDGAMVHFPVQRNVHHAGILATTEVFDGNLAAPLAAQAVAARTVRWRWRPSIEALLYA